jgi:hypothetical protein
MALSASTWGIKELNSWLNGTFRLLGLISLPGCPMTVTSSLLLYKGKK